MPTRFNKPDPKEGVESDNIYGDIPENGNHEDNNRRSTVNPAAQNPNTFRTQTFTGSSSTTEKDPVGPAFTRGVKEDK